MTDVLRLHFHYRNFFTTMTSSDILNSFAIQPRGYFPLVPFTYHLLRTSHVPYKSLYKSHAISITIAL